MPIIFKNEDSKIGFQLGQRFAHRSTNEPVEQLLVAALLELSQKEVEIGKLRYEMAKREREEAFRSACRRPGGNTEI
jgi:hypothetical protein